MTVNKCATIQGVKKFDANGVLASVVNGFEDVGINSWKDGLVAFGSDGASVMVGVRNVVIAKMHQLEDVP